MRSNFYQRLAIFIYAGISPACLTLPALDEPSPSPIASTPPGVIVTPTPTRAATPTPTPTRAAAPSSTPAPTGGATAKYYLDPNGNDTSNCSQSTPCKSLNKLWSIIQPGDHACLQNGEYLLEQQPCLTGKSGTPGNMIKVWACPGAKPVLKPGPNYAGYDNARQCNNNGASWRIGIVFEGNYVHFKGLEITGFLEHGTPYVMNPLFVTNSSFNIFEQLDIHHNGGGGMYIHGDIDGNHGPNGTLGISEGNLILNSDFHHNYDTNTNGGNSDGMAIGYNRSGGLPNTIRGCRAWWNSDDGFDSWENSSHMIWENNWSWYNGYRPDTFNQAGNGDGFKLGLTSSVSTSTMRTLKNNLAFKNREHGFDKNGAQCKMEFYNNTAYDNGLDGFQTNNPQGNIFKNNISYKNHRNQMVLSSDRIADHNAASGVNNLDNWSDIVSDLDFMSMDFAGVDGPRQSDGSLPRLNFLRLKTGSDLIDSGTNVGLPFNGSAPDIGVFEY